MRVRRPQFDFSRTSPHWAENREFAQFINASSFPVPWLERFLNRVMAKAAGKLKDDDEAGRDLRQRIRTFIRQEANHYTIHEEFNAILGKAGYDLTAVQQFIASEYDRLWKTKSFAFCLAYCEGFETLGPPLAHVWLDELEDLLEGADPEVVGMWKWHLMEEFEHRTVAYDAFHTLAGGYFLRLYGYFYQLWHLTKMNNMACKILIDTDRSNMSSGQIKESRRRLTSVKWRMARSVLATTFRIVWPSYTPHQLPEPRNFEARRALLDEPR